jgi:hypothetical protein
VEDPTLGQVPDYRDVDVSSARAVCREALDRRGGGWLSTEETQRVLQALRFR